MVMLYVTKVSPYIDFPPRRQMVGVLLISKTNCIIIVNSADFTNFCKDYYNDLINLFYSIHLIVEIPQRIKVLSKSVINAVRLYILWNDELVLIRKPFSKIN